MDKNTDGHSTSASADAGTLTSDCVKGSHAPELLAALLQARELLAAQIGLPVSECIGGDFAQINAAIAKATEVA